jgi:hypothetical protein
MKEYRIVKETTTNTNITKYYIEEKRKFLKWEWWKRKTYYHSGYNFKVNETYDTYKKARKELDRLTDNVIREVVE